MAFHARMIESWSWSRWSDYDKCHFLAFCKHVLKIKEPGNKAMDRGSAIHKEAEDFVKGVEPKLSPNLKLFSTDIRRLKKLGATAEGGMNFRKDWTETVYNDWDNVWVRIKVDAELLMKQQTEALVIDYKTGQFKPEGHALQMGLYAVGTFAKYPTVEKVTTSLWFLDHGPPKVEEEYTRDEFDRLRKDWERRVAPMMADKVFKPNPGNHCAYCFHRKDNGGRCKF